MSNLISRMQTVFAWMYSDVLVRNGILHILFKHTQQIKVYPNRQYVQLSWNSLNKLYPTLKMDVLSQDILWWAGLNVVSL